MGDVGMLSDYYPFGMQMPGRSFQSSDYRYGYNGMEKDDEVKGEGNSYTTHFRQLDPRVGRWLSIDPKANAQESPYVSMGNNPILFVDPLGDTTEFYDIESGEHLGTLYDNTELRRFKVDRTLAFAQLDYAEDMLTRGHLEGSTRAEKDAYKASTIVNGLLLNESLMSDIDQEVNYISAETGAYSIGITGEMRNNIIADVTVSWQSVFDDGSVLDIDQFDGTAGGYGNGPPENGDYTVNNYYNRGPNGWYNRGMTNHGVGFSYHLNPQFDTNRDLLRIHPDGNNEGTLGCIGLSGSADILNRFRNTLNNYLDNTNEVIDANIDIDNNPNNDGSNGSVPDVNE